jgi:hypothetical protein
VALLGKQDAMCAHAFMRAAPVVQGPLADLEMDVRRMMQPNTAMNLKESRRNVVKDFVQVRCILVPLPTLARAVSRDGYDDRVWMVHTFASSFMPASRFCEGGGTAGRHALPHLHRHRTRQLLACVQDTTGE